MYPDGVRALVTGRSESLLESQVSVIATMSRSCSWMWSNMSVVLLRIDHALIMHNDADVVGHISGFDVSVTGIRLPLCCCEDSTRT